MQYKSQKQYRRKGYDYSQDGFYFITICCKNREMFFGNIKNEKMQLSKIGKIAEKFYLEIPNHFQFIKLDKFVIMPNHIHGIIEIDNRRNRALPCSAREKRRNDKYYNKNYKTADKIIWRRQCNATDRTGQCPVPTDTDDDYSIFGHVTPKSISTIIGSFKSIITKTANRKFYETGFAWQSRFHDRIIQNNNELNRIRQYIMDNPLKWEIDRNNLENLYM
ncbi:transposase [Candidatus Parcubacteria bacterium]|nr:transposase [Candidatus Parcubacteria bacterium]